ncbi:AraC family transcriptional regulator [Gelidibacter mesophilus]|uniref:AraC family transcriptional regulator n=1 Tax=Gelidibacter mesophilus TaxID=169050 RepID=UPI000415F7B9|nr:AraC family transcriptional regulator [Gelidibacter mesophilus]
MRNQLLFFVFLIGAFSINVQEPDTLVNISTIELKQLIVDNMRSNPKTSVDYCKYLLKKSEKTNDYETQGTALNLMGESNRILGNLNLALENQLSAESLLDKVDNPELKVSVFNSLGNIHSDLGIYDKVLPAYFEAIRIAEAHNFTLKSVSVKHNLAYFKDQIGNYNEALTILKEGRKVILEDESDLNNEILAKNDMLHAMVFTNLKEPDSVLFYTERAIAQAKFQNDQFSLAGIYRFMGTAYAEKNQYEKAFKNLYRADSLSLEIGNKITLMQTRFSLASVYYKVKNYDEVIAILENSVALTERDSLNYSNNDANYELLAKAYKEKGDYEKANSNFEKYIQKHNSKKDLNQIIDTNFNQKKIEEFQAELFQLKSEKDDQHNNFKYLGLAATLVIFGLLIIQLKFYRNKKRNEEKFNDLQLRLNTLKTEEKQHVVDTKDEVLEDTVTSDVSDDVTQQILSGLKKLEAQEYFLKQECNAYNVSKKIKTNTSYLSKVVNSHYQKNFNTYINDLRINYAIVRLENDSRFRSFSIQSISEELGYKSADSFTKYFKQNTGLNPSFYIKQLKSLK